MEIAVSIATPYLCALGARWLGLSVVVVIMAAALTVAAVRVDRETGAPRTSAEARISAVAFWEEVSLLVSAAMFFLAGRALPEAMAELNRWTAWRMAGAAAALLLLAAACGRDERRNEAIALTNGDPDRGRVLLRTYGCASCHTIPGVDGATGLVGPPLAGVAARSYIGGVLTNTPANMVRWIRDPKGVDSLTAMPNVGVTAADARRIAAYLYTLR